MSVRLIGQGLGNKGGRGADVVINVCFSGVYSSIWFHHDDNWIFFFHRPLDHQDHRSWKIDAKPLDSKRKFKDSFINSYREMLWLQIVTNF